MVVVLSWLLILFSTLCLSFNREARLDRHLARHESETIVARALARSGIEFVESLLARTDGNTWDAPVEGWDCNPALRSVPMGEGFFAVGHASPDNAERGSIYGVEDEERRIPMHCLTREVLSRIPGMTAAGMESIAGALARRSAALGPALPLPADLDTSSRAALLRDVSPYAEGGVNVNTASREVLLAIGVPPSAVLKIIERRDGPDGTAGTADDTPFASLLLPEGGLNDCGLDAEEAAAISSLARSMFLTTRSFHYRVRSRGWIAGHQDAYEIEVLLHRTAAGDLAVTDWSERWAR